MPTQRRSDGTGFRSSREAQFYALWCGNNPYGEDAHPEREFEFSTERKWRFDFAWPAIKVAVEIQGFGGAHQSIAGLARDAEKIRDAMASGWIVIPVTSACLGSIQKRADLVQQIAHIMSIFSERVDNGTTQS